MWEYIQNTLVLGWSTALVGVRMQGNSVKAVTGVRLGSYLNHGPLRLTSNRQSVAHRIGGLDRGMYLNYHQKQILTDLRRIVRPQRWWV